VLARATSPDPAARYESAADMAAALREAGRLDAGSLDRPRRLTGEPTGQVAIFPGAHLKPAAVPEAPQEEQGDLWRGLLLLVASLLLMTVVLMTGWILVLDPGDAPARSPSRPVAGAAPPVPTAVLSR